MLLSPGWELSQSWPSKQEEEIGPSSLLIKVVPSHHVSSNSKTLQSSPARKVLASPVQSGDPDPGVLHCKSLGARAVLHCLHNISSHNPDLGHFSAAAQLTVRCWRSRAFCDLWRVLSLCVLLVIPPSQKKCHDRAGRGLGPPCAQRSFPWGPASPHL